MKEFSYFTNDWNNRVNVCNSYEKLFEKKYAAHNLQNVKTPMFLIKKMIDKTSSLTDKKILVLFNFEFIDCLIHQYKVNPNNLYFVADCHQDMCKVIKKMYNLSINNIIHHSNFKDGSLTAALGKMSMKFDLCITNPPYNRGLDLKILDSVKDICDEIVCIHPSTWLLASKQCGNNYSKYNDLKIALDKNIRSFEFITQKIFGDDAGTYTPLVITHYDKNYENNNKINVINFIGYFGIENFEVTSSNEITKFGKDYSILVKPFKDKMEEICKDDNVYLHMLNKKYEVYDSTKFYAQTLYGVAGGDLFANAFYTILPISDKQYMRSYEDDGAKMLFVFDTLIERENFLNYCKTDFARFCLALLKIDLHLSSGEMGLIPWLDFTQEWNDEKLFKHFEIDEETQEYIRKFLPDYYSIRK